MQNNPQSQSDIETYAADLAARGYDKGRMMKILTQQRGLSRKEAKQVIRVATHGRDTLERAVQRTAAENHIITGIGILVMGGLLVLGSFTLMEDIGLVMGPFLYLPLAVGAGWLSWGMIRLVL